MKKHRFSIATPALCAVLLAFLAVTRPANAAGTPAAGGVRVKIVTQDGSIVVALDSKRAPKTTANFLHYVDRKFYSGGTFFRVVPGFMIQGGNRSQEKPADIPVPLEAPATTGIHNDDGAISMARTSDPNSGTSEFFICDGKQSALDGSADAPGYAAFGHVLSGMDTVRRIARMPASGEQLLAPVKILDIVRVR